MHPFDQHFDKLAGIGCIRVEVADLLQINRHGLVAAAYHHQVGTDLLGNLRRHPGNFRYQHGTIRHLDGVHHHFDLFFGCHIDRHQHGLDRSHIGIRIERDIATGQQADLAYRLQQALTGNGDGATVEVGTGHRSRCATHLISAPSHTDTGMHVYVALGDNGATDTDRRASAEQRPAGQTGDLNGAVDGHGRGHHVDQVGSLGNGRFKPGSNGTARQHQRVARFQVQRRLSTCSIHIAA